jgi:hypothetical protein
MIRGWLAALALPFCLASAAADAAFTGTPPFAFSLGITTWSGSLLVPVRTVTASGAVTISAATDYLVIINKTTPAATTVNFTCSTGLTFEIKDGAGVDQADPITLTPSSGTIDGAASFVMNASNPGTPPYEIHGVTCDSSGNAWVN